MPDTKGSGAQTRKTGSSDRRLKESLGHTQGRGGLRRRLCPPHYPTVGLAAVTDKDNEGSDTKGEMKV